MQQKILRSPNARPSWLGALAILMLALAACSTPEALAPHEPDVHAGDPVTAAWPARGPDVPDLLERAAAGESVRVLVELAVPAETEAGLSAQAVSDQRLRIAAAQQGLIGSLAVAPKHPVRQLRTVPFIALRVDQAGLLALMNDPAVAAVHEDTALQVALQQSVPLTGADAVIEGVPGFDGTGQAVVIIDTGVEADHPFLAGRVVAEACFSTTDSLFTSLCRGGAARDVGPGSAAACTGVNCFHGTHMAGIIAGSGDGFTGMAPGASLVSIKAASGQGSGSASLLYSDVMAALEFVLQLADGEAEGYGDFATPIAAVNLSLAESTVPTTCNHSLLTPLIDTLRAEGIATVAASGNGYSVTAISAPACISSVISVGATDDSNKVASSTNTSGTLQLLAPGTSIRSSVPGGAFAEYTGTSMAAAHVAGAIALLREAHPDWSVSEVLDALISTGLTVTDSRSDAGNRRIPLIQVDGAIDATPSASTQPSALRSSLLAPFPMVLEGGRAEGEIRVQVRSGHGELLGGAADELSIASTYGSVGSIREVSAGHYSATLTATTPGVATVTARVGGQQLPQTYQVTISHPRPRPQGRLLLWEQMKFRAGSLLSSVSLSQGGGAYVAVDFEITEDVILEYIHLPGEDRGGQLSQTSEIRWYVFGDDGGRPAGYPGEDEPLWSHVSPPLSPGVELLGGITIDLAMLEPAAGIELAPGTYWLMIAPMYDGRVSGYGDARWLRREVQEVGGHPGMIWSPLLGLSTWTDTRTQGNMPDFAVHLRGQLPLDFDGSTVSVAPSSLPADGASTATVTVQLRLPGGGPLGRSGGEVTLASTLGSLGEVTDHADGTYTAAYTAGGTPGTAVITAALGGRALGGTATVTLSGSGTDPKPEDASVIITGAKGPNVTAGPGQDGLHVLTAALAFSAGNASSVDVGGITVTIDDLHRGAAAFDASGIAALEVRLGGADGSLLGSATTVDASGRAVVTFDSPLTGEPGGNASLYVSVNISGSQGMGLAHFVLAGLIALPLAAFGSGRGRRLLGGIVVALLLMLIVTACGGGGGQPVPDGQLRYRFQLTGVDATIDGAPASTSGLPIEGAEVRVNLSALR